MSFEEEGSEKIIKVTRPNKKTYHIIKKTPKIRNVRKETMREYVIHKRNFKPEIPIRSDFICDACGKEIEDNKVFIGLSDKEVQSFIRHEKSIYHRDHLPYHNDYPHLGILVLTEERMEFKKRKGDEKHAQASTETHQEKEEKQSQAKEKITKKTTKKKTTKKKVK